MFVVRKTLDAADVQGERDMSGFVFDVIDAAGASIGRLTTGADGRTDPLAATAGTYTIAEMSEPPWASGLTGAPITFDFEPGVDPDDGDHDASEIALMEVPFVNVVPTATIATSAIDRADGDRVIDLRDGDATIVDNVTYTGLVPGTEYTATGELMVGRTDPAPGAEPDASGAPSQATIDTAVDPSGDVVASSTVAMPQMVASGIVGSTTFVPSEPDGQVEVAFVVPADSPLLGHVVVVYQRLVVATSGRVVAVHADPTASDQTIRFVAVVTEPPPATTVPTTTVPGIPVEPPPPTSTTSTTSTTAAPPEASSSPAPSTPARLPRTGAGGGHSMALGGMALLLIGAGLLLVTRSTPASSTSDAAPTRPHG